MLPLKLPAQGKPGKGFSVVAEQIRKLSTETKDSSGQISEALSRLDEISGKMTSSIEETLKLIQVTLEKVTQTGENVNKITQDSSLLGEHIQTIDSAMKEVESSNRQLVENMEQVSSIVETMTTCISDSDETSKRMLSKYEESASNINNIENVIQELMCELGIGWFFHERLELYENALIVGTHALIQEKPTYANLALVITDEQHRFGVRQRERSLRKKGICRIFLL